MTRYRFMKNAMRKISMLMLCVFHASSKAQIPAKADSLFKAIHFSESNIYIFARGTARKSALIAKDFNLIDSNITHVGLGFLEGRLPVVFHVTDMKTGTGSALKKESLSAFTNTEGLYYFSIWSYRTNSKIVNQLKTSCEQALTKKIWFDANFMLGENDSLYCSEFCSLLLRDLNIVDLQFKPTIISIENKFYEAVLGRHQLTYYPVDFFQTNLSFVRIFEQMLPVPNP